MNIMIQVIPLLPPKLKTYACLPRWMLSFVFICLFVALSREMLGLADIFQIAVVIRRVLFLSICYCNIF